MDKLAAQLQLSQHVLPSSSELDKHFFSQLGWPRSGLSFEQRAFLAGKILSSLDYKFTKKWKGLVQHDQAGLPVWPHFTTHWISHDWDGDTDAPSRATPSAWQPRPSRPRDAAAVTFSNKERIVHEFANASAEEGHGGPRDQSPSSSTPMASLTAPSKRRNHVSFVDEKQGARHGQIGPADTSDSEPLASVMTASSSKGTPLPEESDGLKPSPADTLPHAGAITKPVLRARVPRQIPSTTIAGISSSKSPAQAPPESESTPLRSLARGSSFKAGSPSRDVKSEDKQSRSHKRPGPHDVRPPAGGETRRAASPTGTHSTAHRVSSPPASSVFAGGKAIDDVAVLATPDSGIQIVDLDDVSSLTLDLYDLIQNAMLQLDQEMASLGQQGSVGQG
ncbi:hypothetical protein C1H76_5918 [Elsinoe australis]|uniref:Uncharacterized protein n=1 Tax=Elsinoe australis TaxID=40998 RepID=A0A4U7B3F3_9PEZI|nr:hypothetical protein C1H76_5918 [Elsinoe australis]